ncbi:hypothetical protein QBC40DRAFT_65662 [Triangularia verruculosa]|uniref:Uncharacterized protein n=1 Tax=Triangularia verruculosa TaxID=2587418 RepID=A0AAN7AXI5_9PEZI|nr:hypothetical protein QBC40DRAFT_65662 [Triangularia verruculosa]
MGDIFISNGTCYGSAGNELDSSFIPCGNAAFGPVTCCGAGDVCLSHNACFGVHGTPGSYGADLTYLAGCTDESYRDGSCPDKYGIDQPWIALTQCDDSGGAWAPCPQEGSPTTLQNGAYCSCTDAASTTIAIRSSTRLADIARLPQTTGGTVSFFPGNQPTNTSPPAQTTGGGGSDGGNGGNTGGGQSSSQSQSQSQSQSPGTTGQPANTGSNTSNNPVPSQTGSPGSDSGENGTGSDPGSDSTDGGGSSSGLNSGAKIGIGIGAAIGGLILIATLLTLWHYNRKNRRSPASGAGIEGGEKPKKTFAPVPSPRASEADSNPVSEADGKAVTRPWSMRSELEGNSTAAAAGKMGTANGNQKLNGVAHPDVGELDGREVQEAAPHHNLSPVAELPGSEAWAQAPGGGRGRV